jgi:hypothetical protein
MAGGVPGGTGLGKGTVCAIATEANRTHIHLIDELIG